MKHMPMISLKNTSMIFQYQSYPRLLSGGVQDFEGGIEIQAQILAHMLIPETTNRLKVHTFNGAKTC